MYNSYQLTVSEDDLAIISGPPVDFETYRRAVRSASETMARQYATIRDVTGRQVLVMSAVCDFEDAALTVASVLESLGAVVRYGCAWCKYERLDTVADSAHATMTVIEGFDEGEVEVIFVASAVATTTELYGMAEKILFDEPGRMVIAHVGVIAPVVARNSRMTFANDTLLSKDMSRLTWAYGELSDSLQQTSTATPSMLRRGFKKSSDIDVFPPFIMERAFSISTQVERHFTNVVEGILSILPRDDHGAPCAARSAAHEMIVDAVVKTTADMAEWRGAELDFRIARKLDEMMESARSPLFKTLD
ncbi:hypothetical protein G6L37_05280 [Agrobacterium rubi]|nr:hypothetical protein [Agrobacterium rubi]NTF24769.1 hypothetical protein [Agrobacterium rubi]